MVINRFIDKNKVAGLAERLRKAVEKRPFNLGNKKTKKITCSIGFACFPFLKNEPGEMSWHEITKIADKCLYAAKKTERNAWVGLLGKAKPEKEEHDNLYQMVQDDIDKLIEGDELEVQSSIKDKPINWKKEK